MKIKKLWGLLIVSMGMFLWTGQTWAGECDQHTQYDTPCGSAKNTKNVYDCDFHCPPKYCNGDCIAGHNDYDGSGNRIGYTCTAYEQLPCGPCHTCYVCTWIDNAKPVIDYFSYVPNVGEPILNSWNPGERWYSKVPFILSYHDEGDPGHVCGVSTHDTTDGIEGKIPLNSGIVTIQTNGKTVTATICDRAGNPCTEKTITLPILEDLIRVDMNNPTNNSYVTIDPRWKGGGDEPWINTKEFSIFDGITQIDIDIDETGQSGFGINPPEICLRMGGEKWCKPHPEDTNGKKRLQKTLIGLAAISDYFGIPAGALSNISYHTIST